MAIEYGSPPQFVRLLEEIAANVRPKSLGIQLSVMAHADQRDLLPRIAVPTLVIAGEEDVLTRPKGMEEIAALIPGAKYHLIASTGHMIPIEQSAPLAALLDPFLATHLR